MGSIFNPNGRKYYILEHKVSSKYHKAGESQEIIVDNIEIGRDPHCQVRFDESFKTVSRHHAAIVRDGDMWKLVQISKTNSTFLNGHPVKTEWYLQNGDEIQLSVNGPKLGFIIPTGKKSTVGSIGLTRRLSLFRQQALRPYKTALTVLSCVLVLAVGASTFFIHKQHGEIEKLSGSYAEAIARLQSINKQNDTLNSIVAEMDRQIQQQDSLNDAYQKRINELSRKQRNAAPAANISKLIDNVKSSVYFIQTTVYIKIGDDVQKLGSSGGTAFLLNDGRFVTARHCIESWLYPSSNDDVQCNILNETYSNVTVWSEVSAFGMNNDDFKLRSSDFTIDRSKDVVVNMGKDDQGIEQKMRLTRYLEIPNEETGEVITYGTEDMGGTDWAVARINKNGTIVPNPSLSTSLTAGMEVHVLGFPARIGVDDGQQRIEPIYNKMSVARTGLNNQGCIMVSQGVAHGNSGGPVFTVQGNQLYAVAIVSRLEGATQQYNKEGTAIKQQQQQYDQLIPIKNIR